MVSVRALIVSVYSANVTADSSRVRFSLGRSSSRAAQPGNDLTGEKLKRGGFQRGGGACDRIQLVAHAIRHFISIAIKFLRIHHCCSLSSSVRRAGGIKGPHNRVSKINGHPTCRHCCNTTPRKVFETAAVPYRMGPAGIITLAESLGTISSFQALQQQPRAAVVRAASRPLHQSVLPSASRSAAAASRCAYAASGITRPIEKNPWIIPR